MGISVGLDVGIHHVRALALRCHKGGGQVVGHAMAARRSGDGTERPLATVLGELSAALSIAHPAACASSEIEVLARFLHVVPLPPDRLNRLLRLELAGEDGRAPGSADAIRLASGGEELAFLGLVADELAVRGLQSELARSGVRPRTISWGPLGLAAAAMRMPLDGDDIALVADIGATGTDVALVQGGRLLACRRLGIGGDLFTQALVETGMTPEAAEAHKVAGDFTRGAMAELAAAAAPAAAGDDAGLQLDFGEALPGVPSPGQATTQMAVLSLGPVLTRTAETLYGQLATTLAFFKAQLKRKELSLSRVYLCGGGAGLLALDEYLQRRFQIPVERIDPFQGIAGDAPPEPHRWARALGLALAAGGEAPVADLRPERDLRRQAWGRHLVWPWVAAACLLGAGVCVYLGLSSQNERDVAECEMIDRAVAEHKKLSEELVALEARRDALGGDLRAIAGRIHAARDLLYTVRALKEQTQKSKELWVTSLETVEVGRDDAAVQPAAAGKLGSARSARRDTLIDRGAVDIAGKVRFDVRRSDPELVAFRERYQQALTEWTTPLGWRLFRDVRLTNSKLEHAEKPQAGEGGEFPFRFRCFFQATRLGEGAEAAPTTTPASQAPAVESAPAPTAAPAPTTAPAPTAAPAPLPPPRPAPVLEPEAPPAPAAAPEAKP